MEKRRNLVFIITDQLSRSVVPPYSGVDYGFDAIGEIAAEGCTATCYHTPSAVCTPSRGCILTGLSPFRHGAYRNGLPVKKDIKGIAHTLKTNGYSVAYIGKWHLGANRAMGDSLEDDNLLGFDFIGEKTELGHAKSMAEDGKILYKGIREGAEYTTDYLTRKAREYIQSHKGKEPYALFISYPDPHQPYLVRKPYSTLYAPEDMTVPETFYEKNLPDWAEWDEWGRNHYFPLTSFSRSEYLKMAKAQYLGEVKLINDSLASLLPLIDRDETTLVFTSDHGDYLGQHGLMEKNNLYDDVYNPPLIIRDIRLSGTMDSPMSAEDLMATLLSLIGIKDTGFPGEDMSSCFLDGVERYKDLFIYPSDVPRAGIITDEWKLCFVGRSYDGSRVFKDHILFSRKDDRAEIHNLYEELKDSALVRDLACRILDRMTAEDVPESLIPEALYERAGGRS